MAKVYIEENTANRLGCRTNIGNRFWKIGSNYVMFFQDTNSRSLVYRYSSDGITWSNDVLLFTVSVDKVIYSSSIWYKSIGGSHIIYILHKEIPMSGLEYVYISKWNLDTISSSVQIGSTYNLTSGATWIPLYHNRFAMTSENKLWACGITYNSGGSPYHVYYTIKATNIISATGDSDISAWGTPLAMGDNTEGYDIAYNSSCFLAGSLLNNNIVFGYLSWVNSTTCRLRIRWGNGGNANGDWDPTPSSGEGTLFVTEEDSGWSSTIWFQGLGLQYSPSLSNNVIWLGYDLNATGGYIGRFNLTSKTIYPVISLATGSTGQYIGICCVSRGGLDTVYIINSNNYYAKVVSEELGSISTQVILDNTNVTEHRFVVMPLYALSQDDVFIVYTET